MATTDKWQFAARFRRNAFGWQSQPPIQRIKEALAEIKLVARKEPVLAAEGAVLFLEKLAPAIAQVDSSSGSLGSAVSRAIETLAPIIAQADASAAARQKWLDRLWEAFQNDDIPYLSAMASYWGELCATPAIASAWADSLQPVVESVWKDRAAGIYGYFKGTGACMSALLAAGRHDDLLALLATAPDKDWCDRRWGAKALVAMGRPDEAIRYAEETDRLNAPSVAIAAFCEGVSLSAGKADEAYARYAIAASYGTTNLATFRAIVKKYPQMAPETILRDLAARQPGQEGKWFAAAKDSGLFELAIEFANRSRTDPKTLGRAARDFALERPAFALAAGIMALRGIARGDGYEITGSDVLDAYAAVRQAAAAAGIDKAAVDADVRALIAASPGGGEFVARMLTRQLAE